MTDEELRKKKCPIGLSEIHCLSCIFSKERLCDFPYMEGMSGEEIAVVTDNLKNLRYGEGEYNAS